MITDGQVMDISREAIYTIKIGRASCRERV